MRLKIPSGITLESFRGANDPRLCADLRANGELPIAVAMMASLDLYGENAITPKGLPDGDQPCRDDQYFGPDNLAADIFGNPIDRCDFDRIFQKDGCLVEPEQEDEEGDVDTLKDFPLLTLFGEDLIEDLGLLDRPELQAIDPEPPRKATFACRWQKNQTAKRRRNPK